jgi:hypothetical protein
MLSTEIIVSAGSELSPLNCTESVDHRKVPRAGFAAAQEDGVFAENRQLRTEN